MGRNPGLIYVYYIPVYSVFGCHRFVIYLRHLKKKTGYEINILFYCHTAFNKR